MTEASDHRHTFAGPAALFLRALGLIYVAAFGSLAVQIRGLYGSDGILPVKPYLAAIRDYYGAHAFWKAPTIFWLNASDHMLTGVCWTGVALGALVLAGILQAEALTLLWMLYLSLCTIGRVFLGFQWDALLLETGFLAIFLAPWRPITTWRSAPPPRRVVVWLLRFLLFRLMFASGLVKLASGDPAWHSLTALNFHYWTQPLPTWSAFFMSLLPQWFQKLSCLFMFVVELILPFGIFLPRPARLISFAGLAGLQLLIASTGNYGYFNLLTLSLCFLLLDDACFPTRFRPRAAGAVPARPIWRHAIAWTLASLWLGLSFNALNRALPTRLPMPWPIPQLREEIAPLNLVHGYGLFAVMTTSRREISVEGSSDGVTWKPYTFKYKPGDPKRRPGFITPHMPRLDWQMWFAALGSWNRNRWILSLMDRLREGSPDVLGLFAGNPFPGHPPQYVRATISDYHFADFGTWRKTGAWWTAKYLGVYAPTVGPEADAAKR